MKTVKIGERIRILREKALVTNEELALRTGLAESFLEQLQANDVYPSLGPLMKIARGLGVRLGTFLDDHDNKNPLIIEKNHRTKEIQTHRSKDKPTALDFYSLGRGKSDRHMEPFFVEIFPESQADKTLSSHEGEEFMVVISGEMEVLYGQETYVLKPGDSIYYNSIVPHHVCCNGTEPASIYAVLYIPE